jgi:hypothetical protein
VIGLGGGRSTLGVGSRVCKAVRYGQGLVRSKDSEAGEINSTSSQQ